LQQKPKKYKFPQNVHNSMDPSQKFDKSLMNPPPPPPPPAT
jgi:hypothetical protein